MIHCMFWPGRSVSSQGSGKSGDEGKRAATISRRAFILVLLLCGTLGFAPGARATGTLVVGVYSTVDAQPLAGATVNVILDGALIRSAVTLASGEVQFDLAQGLNYLVTVSKSGYNGAVREHVNIVDGVTTRLTIPLEPRVVHTGSWEGTTSQDLPFSFTVEEESGDDVVKSIEFTIDFECLSGIAITRMFGTGAYSVVTRDWFVYTNSFDHGPTEGGTTPMIILGHFTSATSAEGQIYAFVAAFTGSGFGTQPCWFVGTWQAHQTSPFVASQPPVTKGLVIQPE